MDFAEFNNKIDFPLNPNIVYVFVIVDSNEKIIPFYVGESSRNIGRIGDYVSAKFSASTDFKVGEAIKYLLQKKIKIKFLFKESENRKSEEKRLIEEYENFLTEKYGDLKLLNHFDGYNYKNAEENKERQKIREFVDKFINKIGLENNSTGI